MITYEVMHFQTSALIGGPYQAIVLKVDGEGNKTRVSSISCIDDPSRCNEAAQEYAEIYNAKIITPHLI